MPNLVHPPCKSCLVLHIIAGFPAGFRARMSYFAHLPARHVLLRTPPLQTRLADAHAAPPPPTHLAHSFFRTHRGNSLNIAGPAAEFRTRMFYFADATASHVLVYTPELQTRLRTRMSYFVHPLQVVFYFASHHRGRSRPILHTTTTSSRALPQASARGGFAHPAACSIRAYLAPQASIRAYFAHYRCRCYPVLHTTAAENAADHSAPHAASRTPAFIQTWCHAWCVV